MDPGMCGRRALVIGGSSGIGLATAAALLREGTARPGPETLDLEL
jgi:3-oxoacyl-[acyl-carrier protein] reductase